jgi:hypothetical protein
LDITTSRASTNLPCADGKTTTPENPNLDRQPGLQILQPRIQCQFVACCKRDVGPVAWAGVRGEAWQSGVGEPGPICSDQAVQGFIEG